MKKINLIGQKFEKLTVISAAPNILPKNGKGRSYTAWNCQCECGKIITVRTGTLIAHIQKSCGCIVSQSGFSIKSGEKFNNLTTISYEEGFWNCLCDCGNPTYVSTHNLICGNTKSCGCLRSIKVKNNIKKAIQKQTIYTPEISTARRVWRAYNYRDNNCNVTFDQFLELSQKNCYYCGIKPSQTYNTFLKKKGTSQFAKENGNFTYNGLDRIDCNLPHTVKNVVPCCWTCNRAKSDRSQEEFYKYINTLSLDNKNNIINKDLPTKYILASINETYRNYKKNYSEIEIDLQTFYNLSQQPCFYCNLESSNCFNIYLNDKKASIQAKSGAYFYYNGIDRLDNLKDHNINNIVPCCKYCNFAKSKLSLQEFQDWIKRIKGYQNKNDNP